MYNCYSVNVIFTAFHSDILFLIEEFYLVAQCVSIATASLPGLLDMFFFLNIFS